MPSPVKCFCTAGSTNCPSSGVKTCGPHVSHCLLSLTWNETANSHVEYLQDCWPWSDNLYEMIRCPKEQGVCHLMDEATGYRTCCCLGDFCNNKTNTDVVHSKESISRMSQLPGVNEATAMAPIRVAKHAGEFSGTYIIVLVVVSILAFFAVVAVAVLCYLRSKGFKLRKLTLLSGQNRWNRFLPFKRCYVGSRQHVDGDSAATMPWINQRDRPGTGQSCLADNEIDGLTSLVRKISLKSQGCFGQVWLGHKAFHDDTGEENSSEIRTKLAKLPIEVAIKVFPANHESSWMAEVALFRLPGLHHSNILKFYGADKYLVTSDNDGPPSSLINSLEYWLVTEYHPLGSIYDYIRENTIDWSCLLGIAVGIARGLSHLHFEAPTATALVNNGERGCSNSYHVSGKAGTSETVGLVSATGVAVVGSCWKPVIAHRDLNSRNILLKSNMTACIADFGLAIQFESGHFPSLAHPKLGTRRYMAPEVLDGAIQFSRDAYLRIDVYAMGLVFWELMSRCADRNIHSSGGVDLPTNINDPYRAPYELELGPNPTMEELQRLVALEKHRPKFDPVWSGHSSMCFLRETVEECWDQDAEARLSAGCVAERLALLAQQSAHGVRLPDDVPWVTATTTIATELTPPPPTPTGFDNHTGDTSSSLRNFRSRERVPENAHASKDNHLQPTSIPSPPPTVSLTSSPLLKDLRLQASSVDPTEVAVDDQHRPLIGSALSYSSFPTPSTIV